MRRYFSFYMKGRRRANIANDALYVFILGVIILLLFAAAIKVYALDIQLEWDISHQTDIDHYEIFIATFSSQNQSSSFIKLADVPANQTTYTAAALEAGKAYIFQVYAVNTQGHKSYASNIATNQSIVGPDAVLNLRKILEAD